MTTQMNANKKHSDFMRQVKMRIARRNAEAYWIISRNEIVLGNNTASNIYSKMAKHQDNLMMRLNNED